MPASMNFVNKDEWVLKMNGFCVQKGLNGSSTAILGKPYGDGGGGGGGWIGEDSKVRTPDPKCLVKGAGGQR